MSIDRFPSSVSDASGLARLLPPGRVTELEQRLALTADPELVRAYLIRLGEADRPVFERAVSEGPVLVPLLAVLETSDVLAREFIANAASWLPLLDPSAPSVISTEVRGGAANLREQLISAPRQDWSRLLVDDRRRAHLQVLARDASGRASLEETVRSLTLVAETVLTATLGVLVNQQEGPPFPPESLEFGRLSILALGKLGGEELNYSSDLDLIYVYDDRQGNQAGFERSRELVQQQLAILAEPVRGSCAYRVDLRLRPEGSVGELMVPWTSAWRYYQRRARNWERQMLLKARVVAGDPGPVSALLAALEPIIYRKPGSESTEERPFAVLTDARKRMQVPVRGRSGAIDVKRTPGGIRDVEFLVQGLQRLHGGEDPALRAPGTLAALQRLRGSGRIDPAAAEVLTAAYTLFRHVEHRLQVREDRQTHTVPGHGPARTRLARLMASRLEIAPNVEDFDRVLSEHLAEVQRVVQKVLGSGPASESEPRGVRIQTPARPNPVTLDSSRPDTPRWFGEQLQLFPLDAEETSGAPEDRVRSAPDTVALRLAFRAATLRALAESIEGPAPLFSTLARLSQNADAAIDAVLRLIGGPDCPLWVLALGRLGMMEFDVGSDADLVFVVPDAERAAIPLWVNRVQQLIGLLSSFTPKGRILPIDTRLRCGGRDGPLVQPASAVRTYFESRAQPWEGLAWMKARAVAGDRAGATQFLRDLQQIEESRWAGSDRARVELRQMRRRIEQESSRHDPLKAGFGAYYDIDFALLYLRLRGARTFYPALQTPQRIDVVEQSGWMTAGDADFLRQAAILHRAIDHGIRLDSGGPGRNLPADPARLEGLAVLVQRWLPGYFDARDLKAALLRVQSRTRNYFDRLFTP